MVHAKELFRSAVPLSHASSTTPPLQLDAGKQLGKRRAWTGTMSEKNGLLDSLSLSLSLSLSFSLSLSRQRLVQTQDAIEIGR